MYDSAMRFISAGVLKENYESYENLEKDIVRIVFKKRMNQTRGTKSVIIAREDSGQSPHRPPSEIHSKLGLATSHLPILNN